MTYAVASDFKKKNHKPDTITFSENSAKTPWGMMKAHNGDAIQSESFKIAMPGMHINMHMLKKEAAIRKFKRISN